MQNTDQFNSFSFEISLLNLAGIVKNPKIILRDDSDSILLKKDYKSDSFNIQEVQAKILQTVKRYIALNALSDKRKARNPKSNISRANYSRRRVSSMA